MRAPLVAHVSSWPAQGRLGQQQFQIRGTNFGPQHARSTRSTPSTPPVEWYIFATFQLRAEYAQCFFLVTRNPTNCRDFLGGWWLQADTGGRRSGRGGGRGRGHTCRPARRAASCSWRRGDLAKILLGGRRGGAIHVSVGHFPKEARLPAHKMTTHTEGGSGRRPRRLQADTKTAAVHVTAAWIRPHIGLGAAFPAR